MVHGREKRGVVVTQNKITGDGCKIKRTGTHDKGSESGVCFHWQTIFDREPM